MMNDDSPATSTSCGQCGLVDRKILHHIRLSGTFLRLCTTCVLRLHSKYFCPSCLTVYQRSPPDHAVVCYKCHSSSHRTCVSPSVAGRTLCFTCLNPNGLVFDFKAPDWRSNTNNRGIGLSAARLLLAAAEISSMLMSKAEEAAGMEADWRAKEASEWRKKANHAVNHVVKLMEIEKKKSDEKAVTDNVNGNGKISCVAMPVMDVRIDNNIASIEVYEVLNEVKFPGEPMCRV